MEEKTMSMGGRRITCRFDCFIEDLVLATHEISIVLVGRLTKDIATHRYADSVLGLIICPSSTIFPSNAWFRVGTFECSGSNCDKSWREFLGMPL
jgi:hypothetical protein